MKLKYGNLWDTTDPVILVTANSYITKDGRLVMGRGAALELKNLIPGFDFRAGERLLGSCGHLGKYGVEFFSYNYADGLALLGIFQVKYNFKDRADLDLIKYSTDKLLSKWVELVDKGYDAISMNFPGIGYGGLNFEDVLPIVSVLPDNVTLCIRGEHEVK